jgi:hypothetical protein
MSHAVSILPPGSMAEPATDELSSYMTDPVGFLWERYRQYGRIFTVHLGQPTVFMGSDLRPINLSCMTTRTALVWHKHGPRRCAVC